MDGWSCSWKMVLTVVAQQFGSTQILGFSETPHSTSCCTAKPAIFHFVGPLNPKAPQTCAIALQCCWNQGWNHNSVWDSTLENKRERTKLFFSIVMVLRELSCQVLDFLGGCFHCCSYSSLNQVLWEWNLGNLVTWYPVLLNGTQLCPLQQGYECPTLL